MRDTIPKELLVFVGERDAELDEDMDHGIFLTYLLNKREASKAVIKNRTNKLVANYGDYVGNIKVVTLKNSGFTLELPEVDAMRITTNVDSIPVIIHHPGLEEYKNHKLAIQINRHWFLELLLKARTISAGKLSGNFLVEFKYGGNSINFISELEVLEDDNVKNSIKIGELLADPLQWTDKLTPGRWYILKERNNWLCRSIYLGEYSCIVDKRYWWGTDRRSPFSHHDELVRETFHIFKDAPYTDDDLDQLVFPDLIKTIDFGYWNCRSNYEMKKYPGIEMGEIMTAKGLLSEIIENQKDEFWDACMENISEFIGIVPPEEVRKRKDKLINLIKKNLKSGRILDNSDEFISDRLTNLFGFSDIEAKEIINELWK